MVTYDDKDPWPETADGDGYYLELIDSGLDNNDPENWYSKVPEFDFTTVLNLDYSNPEVLIYPNPAKSNIYIRGNQVIQEITFRSIDGRTVYQDYPLSQNHNIYLPENFWRIIFDENQV